MDTTYSKMHAGLAGEDEKTKALDAAELLGKVIPPALRAALLTLPLAALRDTLAKMPAKDHAAGDESYQRMHADLGLKGVA